MGKLIFCFFYILLFIHSTSLYLSHLDAILRNSLSSPRFGADHKQQRNEAEPHIINPQTAQSLGCFWQDMALVG